MSNYYYPSHTKIQGAEYISQTESKTPNRSQQPGLSNDLQKTNTKTKKKTDPIKTNDLDGEDSVDDDELMCDNEIFGDILTKIKDFVDKTKRKKLKKKYLTDAWQIFNDLLKQMDEHEEDLTDEDLSAAVRKGVDRFTDAMSNLDPSNLLDTDLVYAKEIFYMYFNLLNLPVIQDYLKNVEMDDDLKIIYRICTTEIIRMMCWIPGEVDLSVNDPQQPANCIQLLSLMQNYVKTDLKSSDLAVEPSSTEASMTRSSILDLFMCYSDRTNLVPDCIKAGWLDILRDGLIMIYKAIKGGIKVDNYLQCQILTNIHNASFHDDGVKKFIDLNVVDLIKKFDKYNRDNDLAARSCMILALLSTPEQIKNDHKRMNYVLDTLLEMVYDASVSPDYRHQGSSYHLSELLVAFVKLFNDDQTLEHVMEHSKVDLHTSTTVDFFINLMVNYYSTVSNENRLKQLTSTALVNILWSISFQDRYKQKLKNSNTQFKQLIRYLTKETDQKIACHEYIPRYIENIQKAATGLLVNIDEVAHPTTEQVHQTATSTNNNKKAMIMISYSHEDTEFCKQLYEEIKKREYDIWVDFNFLKTGDLWEQIAAGMKHSNIIICLISEDYCKSKSCRLEATYALEKLQANKPVIPVMLRKHELPDWLDIRIAMLKYVRFPDGKKLEQDKLLELMDAIQDALPRNVSQTNPSLGPSVPSARNEPTTLHTTNTVPIQTIPAATKFEKQNFSSNSGVAASVTTNQSLYQGKPIEQWNQNDIFQWFQYNQILPELRDLCRFQDGYQLMNFARIFLETEQLQYQRFSNEFLRPDGITRGQKALPLHEFTKFSNALRTLGRFKKTT